MNNNEKLVYARALAETFTEEELKDMRKNCLTSGINGRITSWSDVGLSSSMAFEFNVVVAIDILTAALDILNGKCVSKRAGVIKKFVM